MARKSSNPNQEIDLYGFSLEWTPDEHQKKFLRQMQSSLVTFVDAPSGTGKTTLALYAGMEALRRGTVKQIIYLRFPDDRTLKQGFLPGPPEQKEARLFGPFYDAIEELGIGDAQLRDLKDRGHMHTVTDTFLRGVNLKETFLIVDEGQNAKTIDDLHLVLTRLHDTSKAVVLGHVKQKDNKKTDTTHSGLTPFEAYLSHMTKKPWAAQAVLVNNYRGEISRWADEIYNYVGEM